MGVTEHYGDDNTETDIDTGRKLHSLRVLLQTRMIDHIPQLKQIGGIRAIPFMQVRIRSLDIVNVLIIFTLTENKVMKMFT